MMPTLLVVNYFTWGLATRGSKMLNFGKVLKPVGSDWEPEWCLVKPLGYQIPKDSLLATLDNNFLLYG